MNEPIPTTNPEHLPSTEQQPAPPAYPEAGDDFYKGKETKAEKTRDFYTDDAKLDLSRQADEARGANTTTSEKPDPTKHMVAGVPLSVEPGNREDVVGELQTLIDQPKKQQVGGEFGNVHLRMTELIDPEKKK